jgi:hypothetical protein
MISVVYHCYLVGNWKEIVNEQLNRLKSSGLYDSADIIEVTVNLDKTDKSEFEKNRDKRRKHAFAMKHTIESCGFNTRCFL